MEDLDLALNIQKISKLGYKKPLKLSPVPALSAIVNSFQFAVNNSTYVMPSRNHGCHSNSIESDTT